MPKKTPGRRKVGSKNRYANPRVVQSWRQPNRAYVSCLATAAWDDGKVEAEITEAVSAIVPRWRSFFDSPPTDRALVMRARNSRCGPTAKTEAPNVSPYKKKIWPIAKRDYRAGKRTYKFSSEDDPAA
ncbi:hypothetical protein JQ580_25905 [Bradyrhizobium japonicum]|uniref:hypothetical protein n=1 Tax=Bradyrhizobium japonicum TaxID=375 RepID=UPI001BA7EA6D|nr:hypothetical protein [Bradyrhizobium japonicum]MBR0994161.1 hypothetical protein [Bradyrhizobium japonicum]